MKTVVGVLAEPPLPGECKKQLLAAHGPDWVAGIYAAMLRDILDGAQAIAAEDYVVLTTSMPSAGAALEVLARQVPVPWKIVAQPDAERGARIIHAFASLFERVDGEDRRVLLFTGDAPSFDVGPLAQTLGEGLSGGALLLAPSENGEVWALAAERFDPALARDVPWGTPAVAETVRVRARERGVTLREVPPWYTVDEPSDVLRLLDELRKHPDRAPRAAQYLVTHA